MRSLRCLTDRCTHGRRDFLEAADRHVRLPMVSGGFARPVRDCTFACYGPGKRYLPKCGARAGIARKYAQGRISLPSHPSTLIPAVREESGIASLSLTEADALAAEKLQLFHKDPFDRMLIAQALRRGLAILTSDRAFELYPVRLIW